MIALHGNNSNVQEDLPYWQPLVERGWLLALPQSSQIYGPQRYRWNDDQVAADELQAHYANLVVEYDIDPARVVVGGFSRGAGLGARAVLDGVIPARGFIAVAPVHPDFAGTSALPDLILSPEQALRGYILLGEEDERYERHSRALVALMRRLNMPCILDRHEGVGHVYPPDFASVLQTAIDFVLSSTALP
jgi:predicted esterase